MFLSSDPEVWFIESSHGMVTKTSGESTVPCVVTNPNIRVTLHDKDTDLSVEGVYVPSEGFKAYLEYRTYVCRGELNGEVKESQSFNVYSIHGKFPHSCRVTAVMCCPSWLPIICLFTQESGEISFLNRKRDSLASTNDQFKNVDFHLYYLLAWLPVTEFSTSCFNGWHHDHLSFLPQSQRTSTPTWMPRRPSWSKANRWQWTAQCKEWSWCCFPGISPTETWVGAEQNKCFCSRALWGFVSWAQMNPRCRDTPCFYTIAQFMAAHQSAVFGWFILTTMQVSYLCCSVQIYT